MTLRTTKIVWTAVALAMAALAMRPIDAAAQATVNPTKAQFSPSPDHNATNSDGTPVVSSYRIEFFLIGASAPFQTVSLGKPTPDGTNTINVDLTSAFVGWPVPGTSYVSDVAFATFGAHPVAVGGLFAGLEFACCGSDVHFQKATPRWRSPLSVTRVP